MMLCLGLSELSPPGTLFIVFIVLPLKNNRGDQVEPIKVLAGSRGGTVKSEEYLESGSLIARSLGLFAQMESWA